MTVRHILVSVSGDLAEVATEVIDAAGGPTKVARVLTQLSGQQVTRDQVQKWKYRGIAPRWAPWIEKFSNKSRHDLRPDIFGKAPEEAPAA